MTWSVEPKPARSLGMRSTFRSAISETRFWSMLIRDSTRRCRSLAAWYSAFSRRSPSSRALDFLRQLELELVIQRLYFVFELLDQPLFHRLGHVPANRTTVLSLPE